MWEITDFDDRLSQRSKFVLRRLEQKAQKRDMYVLKLCTFLRRLLAKITRNRNGHTKSVKFSHFGILGVINRPYLFSQTIPFSRETKHRVTQRVTLS